MLEECTGERTGVDGEGGVHGGSPWEVDCGGRKTRTCGLVVGQEEDYENMLERTVG